MNIKKSNRCEHSGAELGAKDSFFWEIIFEFTSPECERSTIRAKVPRGWLVKDHIIYKGHSTSNMVFVEDEDHKWNPSPTSFEDN